MSNLELQVVADYRMALFEQIIDQLKMREIYEYVLLEGDEHGNLYHNPPHCVRTAMRCVELLIANGWRLQRDLAILICAALFHDFGHTGRPPDRTNVKIAIANLCIAPCVQDYFNHNAIMEMSKIIECTEYPFVIEPVTMLQKIIRDADLMESMEPFHIQTLVHDLRHELKADRLLTKAEFVAAQIPFLANATMYTDAGKAVWEKTMNARVKSFNAAMQE